MKKQKVICIGGPTGVGKTALAIEIAKKFDGEIVSCDSIAIYKGLDIGSAKPTKEEQKEAKHYLIDIVEPYDEFSVAEYVQKARECIANISSHGKIPIVVGGTGLYMKCLLFDMSLGNSEKSDELREKYNKILKEKGNQEVYNILCSIDEKSAKELHPNDTKRVIRAIEIFELTGKKKSEIINDENSIYDYMMIFLNTDRKTLYDRIDMRVDNMIENGLEREVKNLIKKFGLTPENQSMEAIGYKEFFKFFEENADLNEIIDLIKKNSRHYAKRQITWFKKMPNVHELNYKNKDEILSMVNNFLL